MNDSSERLNNDLALWEIFSKVLDHLQYAVDTVDSDSELIKALLEVEQLPGIDKGELSVIFRDDKTNKYQLMVDAGNQAKDKPKSSALLTHPDVLKVASQPLVAADYPMFHVEDGRETALFDDVCSAFAVPMRLSQEKLPVGVFIAQRKVGEQPYTLTTVRMLNFLSDRFAKLLELLYKRLQREKLFDNLRNNLQQRVVEKTIEHESQILQEVLDNLKEHYHDSSIYMLTKNPLELKSYYKTNNSDDQIIKDFRLSEHKTTLSLEELWHVVGDNDNLQIMIGEKDSLYNGEFIKNPKGRLQKVDPKCQSWVGTTIYYATGFPYGHIVLHHIKENAYSEQDVRLLDSVVDFIGFFLGTFRIQKKEELISRINASEKKEETEKIYKETQEYFRMAYGITDVKVWAINNSDHAWEKKWPTQDGVKIDKKWQNKLSNINIETDTINMIYKEKKYLLIPMKVSLEEGERSVVGCLAIQSNKPGYSNTTDSIYNVADALGRHINNIRNGERYKVLTDFTGQVSILPAENFSDAIILQKARKYISQVMFSDNLYIALYDKEKEEISFPLIYKKGEVWKEMDGKVRKLDKQKLGRTEEIILTQQHLLIKTKKDSLEWYGQDNHEDYADNPLASWIGVPILSAEGVRGVIATYHDDLD